MSTANSPGATGNGRNSHNRSRLRMHAPSSIQVGQSSGNMAEWKVAIPLLSPLDIVSISFIKDQSDSDLSDKDANTVDVESGGRSEAAGRWMHPAEPLFCEPAPAFTVPNC